MCSFPRFLCCLLAASLSGDAGDDQLYGNTLACVGDGVSDSLYGGDGADTHSFPLISRPW